MTLLSRVSSIRNKLRDKKAHLLRDDTRDPGKFGVDINVLHRGSSLSTVLDMQMQQLYRTASNSSSVECSNPVIETAQSTMSDPNASLVIRKGTSIDITYEVDPEHDPSVPNDGKNEN